MIRFTKNVSDELQVILENVMRLVDEDKDLPEGAHITIVSDNEVMQDILYGYYFAGKELYINANIYEVTPEQMYDVCIDIVKFLKDMRTIINMYEIMEECGRDYDIPEQSFAEYIEEFKKIDKIPKTRYPAVIDVL